MRKVVLAESAPGAPAPLAVAPVVPAAPAASSKPVKPLFTMLEFPTINPEAIAESLVPQAIEAYNAMFGSYLSLIETQLHPKIRGKVMKRIQKVQQAFAKELQGLVEGYAVDISAVEPNIAKASDPTEASTDPTEYQEEASVIPHPLARAIRQGGERK